MTSIGKRWSRRKHARSAEILAAAAAELEKRESGAVTMASVAARAGIAKGTIYLYYRSKQHLLDALNESSKKEPLFAGVEQGLE